MKKKQIGIFIIILLSVGISYASEKDSVIITDIIDRSLQREEYYSTFAKTPSLLWKWDKPDYALISTGFSSAKGNYTHPQLLFSRNLLKVRTESIKTLPEKGWRFFGGVEYTNGNAETGKWNMSYYLPSNGSPFYYMIEQEGTWKTQSYDFNVAMQKNLSDKLSAGLALKYLGDLTFRTFDSRNDNTTLEMQILPSITFRFGEKNLISLGLIYNRLKNESDISNKYQHGTESEKYHLFFNQGLGTWDNSPTIMRMVDASFGGTTSLRRINRNMAFDVIYSMQFGSEDWLLKSVSTLLDRKENISRYSSFSQDLSLRYRKIEKTYSWITNIDIRNILGTGSVYKETSRVFQENYQLTIIKANLHTTYVTERPILKQVYANINFDKTDQNDYNYGHSLNYNNLESTFGVDLKFDYYGKLNFILGALGTYKTCLYGEHKPMAAVNNFYTTAIAIPAFSYLTSDYLKLGFNFGTEFNMTKSQIMEINIKGDFTKPLSVKEYENRASFTLTDNYLNMFISLCVNF